MASTSRILWLHVTLCSFLASSFAPTCFRSSSRTQVLSPLFHHTCSRRSAAVGFLSGAYAVSTSPLISQADTGAEVRGIGVNPFNGLIFNYRGSDFAGLKGEDIDEPSIPYIDFLEKLKSGDVTFVEFMAPAGDAAYATFKDGSKLRIGEGYPIEQPDGYSSPAFAIRAVNNAGVSYRFTVPNLKNYQAKGPELRRLN